MNQILLQGCQSNPLMGYLKGLGVLRLVAEQVDATAACRWTDNGLELSTELDETALIQFFINSYQPTPVITPWSGGSGYYPKDSKTALQTIVSSKTVRFDAYRDAISIAQQQVKAAELNESPKDSSVKNKLLNTLRAELSDKALDWLDAALSLSGDGQKYPPLLGTGGNDGRLDFTHNFMKCLTVLIEPDGTANSTSENTLRQALFDTPAPYIKRGAIGQFAPAAAGSPNGTTGFVSSFAASPWDYILMIEGAMLFASAAVRRLESNIRGGLSFPFTTRTVGAGSGAAHASDEKNSRAEIWLPLWSSTSQLNELKQMFSEGRVTLGRHNPRDGLEFARAVSQLGNARGIHAFERYAFLMRAGKAYVATPVGRFDVPTKPNDNLLRELDYNHWLGSFNAACRDKHAPTRLHRLQAPLRDQMFALTQSNEHDIAQCCQAILQQLGEIERYAARSPAFQENVPPAPQLSDKWSGCAEDDSNEYQIAAAVASLHSQHKLFTRQLMAPVEGKGWGTGKNTRDLCWQHPDAAHSMSRALDRLSLHAQQHNDPEHGLNSYRSCQLSPIAAWLRNECDDERIHRLVPGLALCRSHRPDRKLDNEVLLPPAYCVLKLLFCGNAQMYRVGLLSTSIVLPNPRPILRLLQAQDTRRALTLAQRRLRIAGLAVPNSTYHNGIELERLISALLIPITDSALRALARTMNHKAKFQTHTQGNIA